MESGLIINAFELNVLHDLARFCTFGRGSMENGKGEWGQVLTKRHCKVCGCYVVTFLNWTLRFDWYVVWSESKSKRCKDMCLK